jgi:hypothetical protein
MKKFLIAISLALFSQIATAEPPKDDIDIVARLMVNLFKQHNLQFLCLSQDSTLESLRPSLDGKLTGIDLTKLTQENANAIATVIYTAFPCPFSPDRPELKLATAGELLGNWIVPEASQKLRYGPKSTQWQSQPGMPPIRCEGVSYYPDGESRVAEFRGALSCPTSKDMEAMRKLPKVETWKLLRDGRLQSNHTGRPNEPEEWDIYVVEKPFEFAKINFATGDLVAYLRKSKNNNLNVSTVFRHLQRLP